MNKDKRIQFINFLKGQLSATRWEDLPGEVGITDYRWSTLINGTVYWNKQEIETLSKYVEIPIEELILKHGVGAEIYTLKDITSIVYAKGFEIGLVQHVA